MENINIAECFLDITKSCAYRFTRKFQMKLEIRNFPSNRWKKLDTRL